MLKAVLLLHYCGIYYVTHQIIIIVVIIIIIIIVVIVIAVGIHIIYNISRKIHHNKQKTDKSKCRKFLTTSARSCFKFLKNSIFNSTNKKYKKNQNLMLKKG